MAAEELVSGPANGWLGERTRGSNPAIKSGVSLLEAGLLQTDDSRRGPLPTIARSLVCPPCPGGPRSGFISERGTFRVGGGERASFGGVWASH